MTGVSRRLLGVFLFGAILLGSALPVWGQERGKGMVLTGPDGPNAPAAPGPKPKTEPVVENLEAARQSAAATTDLLTFFFIVACLAGGVIAIIVAARVYDRFRVDNPIIAAVNDPWVQAKIAQEMAAGNEVELKPADSRAGVSHL